MGSVRVNSPGILSQRIATAIPDDKARAFVTWLVYYELDIPRTMPLFAAARYALFRTSNKRFAITL